MLKDFNKWNDRKKNLDEHKARVFFHEREIWFCHLGVNVGFEQDGKGDAFGRPVIIFKKFNNQVFWGLPLTTRQKKGKFYVPIDLGDGLHRMTILSQLRLLDSKRLYQKFAVISEETNKLLEEKIIALVRQS